MKSTARKKLGRGESQKGEDKKWGRSDREKMQVREMVGKSRSIVFFEYFVVPEGRLAKAASAEPAGQMRDKKLHVQMSKKCTPLWDEAPLEAKSFKNSVF